MLEGRTSAPRSVRLFDHAPLRRRGGSISSIRRGRSQRNVAHHYDLSGALYDLFLDRDLQYSCAYFETAGVIARRGATREEAAPRRQARAQARHESARHRLGLGRARPVSRRDLRRRRSPASPSRTSSTSFRTSARGSAASSERVDFRLLDYRHLDETFDRIVSVGMFEHVGVGALQSSSSRSAVELLKPDGVAVLHSIGRSDRPGRHQSLDRQIHLSRAATFRLCRR